MLKERPVFVDAADNAANRRLKPSEEQAQAKAFKEGRFKALLGAVAAGEVGTARASGASGGGSRIAGPGGYDNHSDWESDNDDDDSYDEGYDLADDEDEDDDEDDDDDGDAPVAVPMHTGDLDDVIAARRPRGLKAPAVRKNKNKNKKFSSRRVR
jgi:hypothetical protein